MKHTVNPCREGMLIKKGTVIDKQFRVGRETESPTTDNSNWKTETVILVFFVFFFFSGHLVDQGNSYLRYHQRANFCHFYDVFREACTSFADEN